MRVIREPYGNDSEREHDDYGAGFCAAWRADPAIASIPVIVVSAASDIGKQAAAMGATMHLTKPLGMEEIFRLIERHCGGGRVSS